jgi:hypothetical protein
MRAALLGNDQGRGITVTGGRPLIIHAVNPSAFRKHAPGLTAGNFINLDGW